MRLENCRRSPALPRGFSRNARVYFRPAGLLAGEPAAQALASGAGRRLAGGRFVFTACEVFLRDGGALTVALAPLAEVAGWVGTLDDGGAAHIGETFARLSRPRAAMLGMVFDEPAIMGVVNVTPDSFSDGGDFASAEAAIAQGRALAEAGAAIVDVGGESTRPGSEAISVADELDRVLPVIERLAADGVVVSIDTRKAEVMRAALDAGAVMINDVSALTHDSGALDVAAASGAPVTLMHTRGDPKTMQADPVYDCAPLDVCDYLEARIEACVAAGIDRARIVVDPGIGFGKSPTGHNIEILRSLGVYHGLGCAIMIGVSRKSFIGRLAGVGEAKQRLPGSLAAGLAALDQGVQLIRVHDVAETAQALAVWNALTD
jgi:dihydropteroate synthase